MGEQLGLVRELRLNGFQIVGADFRVPTLTRPVDDEPVTGHFVSHFDADGIPGARVQPGGSNNHIQGIG